MNIGHGRADVVQAGADQAKELGFFTNWSYAHPPAIELAARIASLAPGDLNRVFFTSGGSEAVESAYKLARQYHKITGNPNKTKLIAREIAYHGTSLGALSATGITSLREPFEPLTPGDHHVPNTNTYRLPPGISEAWLRRDDRREDRVRGPGHGRGRDPRAGPERAAAASRPPDGYFQRVREICDEYNVLLISDEVICAWGRLGEWFGAHKYDYQPDMITTAKGITSAYAPMGAVIASDRVAEPFMQRHATASRTGSRSPGTRCARRSRWRTSTRSSTRASSRTCARTRARSASMLESLRDLPIVGDVRGTGYFHAIELVKDQETKETFNDEESRDAAARLPVRRALPSRPDLPRRRSRRPGDPAVAAADRGAGAVRGDRGRSCAAC